MHNPGQNKISNLLIIINQCAVLVLVNGDRRSFQKIAVVLNGFTSYFDITFIEQGIK